MITYDKKDTLSDEHLMEIFKRIAEVSGKYYLEMKRELQSREDYLLKAAAKSENLLRATEHVAKSGGGPGRDHVTVKDAAALVEAQLYHYSYLIRTGKYKPIKNLKVEIPKPSGGIRVLSIPTARDRIVQQAICQVLYDMFVSEFSESSFAYRDNKSIHDAVERCAEIANAGYNIALQIDIEKFFDTVDQEKLLKILTEKVNGEKSLAFIKKMINTRMEIKKDNGSVEFLEKGIPQGGPLSSVLANCYLMSLDRLLEELGINFVRYADDCVVLVKTEQEAYVAFELIKEHLEKELLLNLNIDKTTINTVDKIEFLGYDFYKNQDGLYTYHTCKKSMDRHEANLSKRIMELETVNDKQRIKSIVAARAHDLYGNSNRELVALDKRLLKIYCKRFNRQITFDDLRAMDLPLHMDICKQIKNEKKKNSIRKGLV